ncbi:MAG: SPOR domain-containing protein, partial [Clostridiales bacterium]|nr:SPOR domain-containing protein [Clostridiales bacterium]
SITIQGSGSGEDAESSNSEGELNYEYDYTTANPPEISQNEYVYSNPEYDDYSTAADDTQVTYGAFYGVWCGASKNANDLNSIVSNLNANGLDGKIFVTTDWSNLNTERWYVVTAGAWNTQAAAEQALSRAQAIGYSSAYVKYSGEPLH